MASTPAAAYIRSQSVGAALANVVLNPLIEWVLNRQKGFQPFLGNDGVAINMALTSIILSVLVALFAARGVRHKVAVGGLSADDMVRTSQLLRRTPARAGWFGLTLGVAAAAAVAVALWLLDSAGVSGMSFTGLLLFKAVYCGVLGFGVTRWTIRRQLAATYSQELDSGS